MAGIPTNLRNLPFSEQIAAIDVALDAGAGATLVAELAAFRDHQPLAHALAELARRDQLEVMADDVAARVVLLPDTGLRRVLRALENMAISQRVAGAIGSAFDTLGVERVAAAAMVDRWLKNVAPQTRTPMLDDALRHCTDLVGSGHPEQITDAALFRVPGDAYAELQTRAQRVGVGDQWSARMGRFATAVLEVLEAQPKSLSQANAEELLARQVYTDPGHFLIELLQNADDAGATVWRVRVFADRVEVEHDGVPFNARDVVGILSIGQTTKSKEQIGFFGVGFKSVYDICERPQVYSGPFAFEIANVSIPRPLAPHPKLVEGTTLLVLPLRDADDPDRSPERLFDRIAALPGEVLLTLNSLQEIHLEFGERSHRVTLTAKTDGRVQLQEQDHSRYFLVEQTVVTYAGSRDANRAQSTPLLVAIATDDAGCPQSIGERPTVYSYLPTGERSGLRFVIHAHFDLPVDRERIDLSSPWNLWAIAQVAPLMSRVFGRLVQEWQDATDKVAAARRLDAAMDVVSLAQELGASAYSAVVTELATVAFLPGAGGERLAAATALIAADPRLVHALAGVELADGRRLLRSLEQRDEAVARSLGAQSLKLSAVVAAVAEDARRRSSGTSFDPPWANSMVELATVVGSSTVELSPLRDTTCLPDDDGLSRRPSGVLRARGELRMLLAPLRPLVNAALDVPACAEFLDRLEVGHATTSDLVTALASAASAHALVDLVGAERVLTHLANAQPTQLNNVELAHVAWTDGGELCAVGEAFLTGESALAQLVRRAEVRPALVSSELEASSGAALATLGAPRLELQAALELIKRGRLGFTAAQVTELHHAINVQRDAISPALAKQIAGAPIFPTQDGRLCALIGDGCVKIPADADIRELWPDNAWLNAKVASLAYVHNLGVEPVGASAVARQLLQGSPADDLRRAGFTYLARHPEALTATTVAALANAPLWPDVDGLLRPVDELRQPSAHPAVARLYELWPRAMTVEPGDGPGTAMYLASALDLAHHIVSPALATAIDDLTLDSADLNLGEASLSAAVTDVLLAAAAELPRGQLDRVRHARVFRCTDGLYRRLGSWTEPAADCAHRTSSSLQAAFAHGRFPLLALTAADELALLLDALGLVAGTAADLVRSIDADLGELDATTATTLRRALVASRQQLVGSSAELAERLAALAIWPTERGLVSAGRTLPWQSLQQLAQPYAAEWIEHLANDQCVLLAPDAEADAAALGDVFEFADPVVAFTTAITDIAITNAPLVDQPAVLGSVDRVAAVALALVARLNTPWTLPVAVNARGCLVARKLLVATADELAFAVGLPVYDQLADLAWAAAVSVAAPDALAHLTPRQVVVAVHDASIEPIAPQQHPCLGDSERRRGWYAWVLQHRVAIAQDEHTCSTLRRSCFVLSAGGILRAPQELMFDAELPDLGIDWNPAAEVPTELCAWLRQMYQPEAKQLRPLLEHLLAALDDAVAASDGGLVAQLVHHLSRVLRANEPGEQFDERVRRFRLRKRLRVETSTGEFERPRTLLAPDARDGDLLARFAVPPPPSVALRYRDDAVLRLCRAAGAEQELSAVALRAYLDGQGRVAGADSSVALACYVASAATRASSLRHDLQLKDRAWLTDRNGTPRPAGDLYWPGDGVADLVGDSATKFVHPEVVHRVADAATWLMTRTAASAALDDVADHLADLAASARPAPETALFWLDEQLGAKTVTAAEVRDAIAELRVFVDDRGRLRYADELVGEGARRLFGDRRGDWSMASRMTRLASALRIPRRPGKREVMRFMQQALDALSLQDHVAPDDSDLTELLPRCVDVLVQEGGRGPAQLLVVCQGDDGTVIAALPGAAERVGFGDDDEPAELKVLCAAGGAMHAWRGYLRAYGVGETEDEVEADDTASAAQLVDETEADARTQHNRQHADEADADADEDEDEQEEGAGIISRFRRWFGGNDDDPEQDDAPKDEQDDERDGDDSDERSSGPSASPATPSSPRSRRRPPPPREDDAEQPFRRVDQRGWFRRDDRLSSQLDSNAAWLADRRRVAEFGLAHSPALLPLPYRYAPQQLFGAFERSRQSWRRLGQDADWRKGGGLAGRMQLRGRLPAGEAVIPLPLYGRIVRHDQPDTTRIVDSPGGSVAISRSDVVITIELELNEAPDFECARAAETSGGELTAITVSDQELPVEVHDLLASIAGETSALVVADTVVSFVRERYVYDPTYLENPEVAAWLKQRTRQRSNMHVAALHAGRDTDHLGRGVCYELNALTCELMRRCDVPCALAQGWTFDRGYIDEPDHLWAMALVDAGAGPRWLPLDASTTRTGRPLHAAHRPPGPWRATKRKTRAPREPDWAKQRPTRRSAESLPIGDLLRVARYVEQVTDSHLGNRAELLAACRALLADPERAAMLAEIIAGRDSLTDSSPDDGERD